MEEKKEEGEPGAPTKFDPQDDQDLFGSIFGNEEGAKEAAAQDLQAASNVMDEPAGATPEESQAAANANPSAEEELMGILDQEISEEGGDVPQMTLEELLGEDEEEEKKPFGDEIVTEDEAVAMSRKEG